MKKKLALLIPALLLFISVAGAQMSVEEVTKALYSGDVSKVAKHFDKLVDIKINREQSTYSKSQAEMVLKNFFNKNDIKSFSLKHKGAASSDNSVFVIGELNTNYGLYKVYLFFKQKENAYYLQELRID